MFFSCMGIKIIYLCCFLITDMFFFSISIFFSAGCIIFRVDSYADGVRTLKAIFEKIILFDLELHVVNFSKKWKKWENVPPMGAKVSQSAPKGSQVETKIRRPSAFQSLYWGRFTSFFPLLPGHHAAKVCTHFAYSHSIREMGPNWAQTQKILRRRLQSTLGPIEI